MNTLAVDEQVHIDSDIENLQSRQHVFAYLAQIKNENEEVVFLKWITGSLSANESLSPSLPWTPKNIGVFEITIFLWNSFDNPIALSQTRTLSVTVESANTDVTEKPIFFQYCRRG